MPTIPVADPTSTTPIRKSSAEISWTYEVIQIGERPVEIFPSTTGTLNYDNGRDISKTLTGLIFLPTELSKFRPAADELKITMWVDDVPTVMGYFVASEHSRQKDVIVDPDQGVVADLNQLSFGDRMSKLMRSDGKSQTIQGGFDPSVEAQDLLFSVGLPFGWEGAASPAGDTIVWDGATLLLSKITQLSELAGHLPPWMNNDGVIRSVLARTPVATDTSIIEWDTLDVEAQSVVVTEAYLTAPNAVVVAANSGGLIQGVAGRWDAPSVAPNSFANLLYLRTQMVSMQGIRDPEHAAQVAKAIGEKASARILNFNCVPTPVFDGPVVVRYQDILWRVSSWSVSTSPNSKMSVQAEEITAEYEDLSLIDDGELGQAVSVLIWDEGNWDEHVWG